MGEVSELILDGVLDSVTGEFIGSSFGYPRTKYKSTKMYQSVNKYGYRKVDWKRMNPESRYVIEFLYSLGYVDFQSRQDILNRYFNSYLNWKHVPKNNAKYRLIHERFQEFKNVVTKWKEEIAVK